MRLIQINTAKQELKLIEKESCLFNCLISSAKNGLGELQDSECTPRGWHFIAQKIGAGAAANTVFVARQATGEIYSPALGNRYPDRDWILTRIIRLQGCEVARNQGQHVDSYQRYIYIHGTPDAVKLGQIGSKGCIRMRNQDLINLFNLIEINNLVYIE